MTHTTGPCFLNISISHTTSHACTVCLHQHQIHDHKQWSPPTCQWSCTQHQISNYRYMNNQSKRCMLRKARQQQHKQKGKATQLARKLFFKEKLAASGGTPTHDHQLAKRCSYQLRYRGSSPGWAESCISTKLNHHNLINELASSKASLKGS